MEVELAGEVYEQPQLKRWARNVLRQRYTDGVIDEMLAPERNVSYEDLARASSASASGEPPSILKTIFRDAQSSEALLSAWILSPEKDADILSKLSVPELLKLIKSRVGLELAEGPLEKLRSITIRYILASEFRADLACPPPRSLESIPQPPTKDEESAVRDIARRLRKEAPRAYAELADHVEAELGLQSTKLPASALGSIDTFRFEERALLAHCSTLIADGSHAEALTLVGQREQSFWLDQDVNRRAQWEACRRMAELAREVLAVEASLPRSTADPKAWVDAYTSKNGWYRVDRAQRRLESWLTNLQDEADERAVAAVRRMYDELCHEMAQGFMKALARSDWSVPGTLTQARVYKDIVSEKPRPVAYILTDSLRYEMGTELAERLPTTAEVSLRPAISALPSITRIGMAALQPGASASFDVVEEKGKLGARIEGTFLPDVVARRNFAKSRVPQLVDLALDDLLGLSNSKLKERIKGATVIVVRSQEIDSAGEGGFRHARRIMDDVIGDIASAVQRLARAGIDHSVIAADHGHLFFAADREEAMRIDSPGGKEIELHRRCWIGRGGQTPPACVRVTAAQLGYASDLEFVFPNGAGVFRAGGDLAYHHGGPSLQEVVIPVISVRMNMTVAPEPTAEPVTAAGLPDAVTNRIFSVVLRLGGRDARLDSQPTQVRPLLMANGKQVGVVGMVTDAEHDRAAGTITMKTGKPATVAFLLSDDTVPALRVVVQDPRTDAELYRSPDIPVRLGV